MLRFPVNPFLSPLTLGMLSGWGVGSPKDPWVAPSPPPQGPWASLGSAPRWDTAAGGLGEPRVDHKSGETEARHREGSEHRRCLGWVPGVGVAHPPPPRGGNFWQTCVGVVGPQVCPMGSVQWGDVGGPGGDSGAGKSLGATPPCAGGHRLIPGDTHRALNQPRDPGVLSPPLKSPLHALLLGTGPGMSPYLSCVARPRPPPGRVPVPAGGVEGLGAALAKRASVSRGVPTRPRGDGTARCQRHPCQVIQGV